MLFFYFFKFSKTYFQAFKKWNQTKSRNLPQWCICCLISLFKKGGKIQTGLNCEHDGLSEVILITKRVIGLNYEVKKRFWLLIWPNTNRCTVVGLSTRPAPLIISKSLQYRAFWSQSKALFMIRCMLSVGSGSKMFGALKVTILCQIFWTFST